MPLKTPNFDEPVSAKLIGEIYNPVADRSGLYKDRDILPPIINPT